MAEEDYTAGEFDPTDEESTITKTFDTNFATAYATTSVLKARSVVGEPPGLDNIREQLVKLNSDYNALVTAYTNHLGVHTGTTLDAATIENLIAKVPAAWDGQPIGSYDVITTSGLHGLVIDNTVTINALLKWMGFTSRNDLRDISALNNIIEYFNNNVGILITPIRITNSTHFTLDDWIIYNMGVYMLMAKSGRSGWITSGTDPISLTAGADPGDPLRSICGIGLALGHTADTYYVDNTSPYWDQDIEIPNAVATDNARLAYHLWLLPSSLKVSTGTGIKLKHYSYSVENPRFIKYGDLDVTSIGKIHEYVGIPIMASDGSAYMENMGNRGWNLMWTWAGDCTRDCVTNVITTDTDADSNVIGGATPVTVEVPAGYRNPLTGTALPITSGKSYWTTGTTVVNNVLCVADFVNVSGINYPVGHKTGIKKDSVNYLSDAQKPIQVNFGKIATFFGSGSGYYNPSGVAMTSRKTYYQESILNRDADMLLTGKISLKQLKVLKYSVLFRSTAAGTAQLKVNS